MVHIGGVVTIEKELVTSSWPYLNVTTDLGNLLQVLSADEIWRTLGMPGGTHSQRWSEALAALPPRHTIRKAKPLFIRIGKGDTELDEKPGRLRLG
jgi:methionyl-tRNA synthetase